MPTATSNGIELWYETFGDDDGPPLLLVMGLGAQAIAGDTELCHAFADRGFRVIRFDNRDVGQSSKLDAAGEPDPLRVWNDLQKRRPVEPPYRLGDMADDAVGLLDAIGIRAAHIVGVSMGGMIAQEVAIRHPERVLTLTSIMSNTGDPNVRGPAFETMMLFLQIPRTRDSFISRSVEVARHLAGPGYPFDADWVRHIAARSYDRGFQLAGVRRQLVAIWTSPNRKPGLARLTMPALVIHGDADPLVPIDGGRDTAQAIPGARLMVIPGMGHDLPRAVWPRIIDAIATHAVTPPGR